MMYIKTNAKNISSLVLFNHYPTINVAIYFEDSEL